MSSLLSLKKTVNQAIYEATCLDIIRELSNNLAEDKPTKESFTSIHGLDKSVQEINFTTGIKELYQQYHNPKISTNGNKNSTMWKNWTADMEILKIGNHDMSINQAMETAGNLFNEIGHQFYGMLLTTKGKRRDRTIFNPLHPIIVTELKKEHSTFDLDEKIWSISIYSFKDERKKEYEVINNGKNYINEIATIISSINSPANYIVENKDFRVDIIDDKFVLDYEEIKRERISNELIEEDDSKDRNYIIPSQIINIAGIAYPYYGVTYSRKGLAWNMTPMYHSNIGHPYNQQTKNGMEGGSRICTNSGNSKTQMGLSSLNHSNTTSPLNSILLCQGALEYAEQNLKASLEMFLGDKFLKAQRTNEKVLTFKEFKKENDGNGTKKDYFKYIKNRMADKMDQKPDTKEKSVAPKYPNYDDKKEYKHGDIVLDQYTDKLRIYRRYGGWGDYEEPVTVVFNNGASYPKGTIVEHEGRAYEAIAESGSTLVPVPGDTVVWRDLSNVPQTPEPTTMDTPPIDLNNINVEASPETEEEPATEEIIDFTDDEFPLTNEERELRNDMIREQVTT